MKEEIGILVAAFIIIAFAVMVGRALNRFKP